MEPLVSPPSLAHLTRVTYSLEHDEPITGMGVFIWSLLWAPYPKSTQKGSFCPLTTQIFILPNTQFLP
jgi:hypothetical protein